MKQRLFRFRSDEDGAVTVDWVLLTATLVLLGFLIMLSIGGGARDHGNWLETTMTGLVTP